jgi:hypothetical protein
MTVEVTGLVGIYTDPGHVIADPQAGLVHQPFAVCFHARPLSGSPGGDQVETSEIVPSFPSPATLSGWPCPRCHRSRSAVIRPEATASTRA